MIRLMREVRFFGAAAGSPAMEKANGWAGTHPGCVMPFWTLRVVVEGPPDPRTGYVCDIKVLDDLVRRRFAPLISADAREGSIDTAADRFKSVASDLIVQNERELQFHSFELRYSPFTWLTVMKEGAVMLLTHSFEFSASHRLWCAGISDDENLRMFGKCSNPHGHGHNYVLEVGVQVEVASTGATLTHLDRVVRQAVIEHFDHKNLNVECSEFADLNPTVENIAQIAFNRLEDALKPVVLANVRVWETAKTYAECAAQQAIR